VAKKLDVPGDCGNDDSHGGFSEFLSLSQWVPKVSVPLKTAFFVAAYVWRRGCRVMCTVNLS
jgi:hypothetical protein